MATPGATPNVAPYPAGFAAWRPAHEGREKASRARSEGSPRRATPARPRLHFCYERRQSCRTRPPSPAASGGGCRTPAQGRRRHPRAGLRVPERRARQRARPPPAQPQRHAGREEDRRRAPSRCRWTRCGSSSASTARRCRCRTSRGAPSRSASRTSSAASRSTGTTAQDDLKRGRIFAQELMKYGRHEKAEKVLSKIVALGGDGEDWLGARRRAARAEEARQGRGHAPGRAEPAQGLAVPEPPARARSMKEKGDRKAERESVERAIQIDNNSVDAWAYLANAIKETRERGRDGRARSRSSRTRR